MENGKPREGSGAVEGVTGRTGVILAALVLAAFVVIEILAVAPGMSAASLNRQAYGKFVKQDYAGAVADYSTVLSLPGLNAEDKARAYAGRSYAYGMMEEPRLRLLDAERALAVVGAPADIRARAYFNRGRAKEILGDVKGTLEDYTKAIEMPGASAEIRAVCLVNRGYTEDGQINGPVASFRDASAVIDMPDAPIELKAMAHLNRAYDRCLLGDYAGDVAEHIFVTQMLLAPNEFKSMAYRFLGGEAEGHENMKLAMAYYRYASRLPFSPDGERGTALCNLAYCESNHDDGAGALRDYEAILKLPHINKYLRAKTSFNVGFSRICLDDYAGAIGPLTDSMNYRGTNEDNANSWLCSAYRWRAYSKDKTGDYKGSIDDYKECLATPDMAEDTRIKLKSEMASVLSKAGRHAEAIVGYTQLAESTFATYEQHIDAILKRGAEREKGGDYKGELADFDIALESARFSADQRCTVLTARGKVRRKHNDIDGALADYAAALAVEGTSSELRAKTFVARGFLKQTMLKDRAGAAADYKAAFSLPGISKEAERVARSNYEEVKP